MSKSKLANNCLVIKLRSSVFVC